MYVFSARNVGGNAPCRAFDRNLMCLCWINIPQVSTPVRRLWAFLYSTIKQFKIVWTYQQLLRRCEVNKYTRWARICYSIQALRTECTISLKSIAPLSWNPIPTIVRWRCIHNWNWLWMLSRHICRRFFGECKSIWIAPLDHQIMWNNKM